MGIEEQDFIDKMVDIARDGYEYIEQLKHVFFTWFEFFGSEEYPQEAEELARRLFEESGCKIEEEYVKELLSTVI